MLRFRSTWFPFLVALTSGCLAVPGTEGEPCNDFGLCAPGLVCNSDRTCVPSGTACSDTTGLCRDASFPCGWFVGPLDVTPAAEMCHVEGREYDLGDSATPVAVDEVYVDRFEVTHDRYRAYLITLGEAGKAAALPECDPGNKSWKPEPPHFDDAWLDHPVVCVNRIQAAAFCAWAGKRLPTSVEWEAAARGTDARTYPWGNDPPDGDKANCENNAGVAGYCNDTYPPGTCPLAAAPTLCDDTAPIYDATGAPTLPDGVAPSGALHMAGNVWEWTADDSATFAGRIRGGSWADFFDELRVWSEREVDPVAHRKTTAGFRCAF